MSFGEPIGFGGKIKTELAVCNKAYIKILGHNQKENDCSNSYNRYHFLLKRYQILIMYVVCIGGVIKRDRT